jgi:hypothetical protein
MELYPVIISALQVSRIALTVSHPFRADLKNMTFHGDYTFSSCPTLPGCSLKVSCRSLEKLSFSPHCLNQEVSTDLGVHHLLLPRALAMRL